MTICAVWSRESGTWDRTVVGGVEKRQLVITLAVHLETSSVDQRELARTSTDPISLAIQEGNATRVPGKVL